MRVELPGLGTLATDHGNPVLLVEGEPYGPGDLLTWRKGTAVANEVLLQWLNDYHADPRCECESDERDGRIVWVAHSPACEEVLQAVDLWLAPLGYRVPR